jgi:ABC-type transport system involved in cytochrome bd biosynthesis fused ATPase/permease subunit
MTNVTLQPPSIKRAAVSNVNVRVPAGTRVAVCGKGGSGKGTLLAGLARVFFPEDRGVIKVGGHDTQLIGRKCTMTLNLVYSQKVQMLSASSMVFTGTLR